VRSTTQAARIHVSQSIHLTKEANVPTIEAVRLTRQQERAFRLFDVRWPDDFVTDGQCWDDARCRPWPTMDNLIRKGLIDRDGWVDQDTGWEYKLTPAGLELLKTLTDDTERGS
jgi:hypothetical protein